MKKSKQYFVLTYDPESGGFTPQLGVRSGPYTLFGLREPLRELRGMGYEASRFPRAPVKFGNGKTELVGDGDLSVLVEVR